MAQSLPVTCPDVLRVLMLVRYFPPSGGSVQRIPRLAKYLARKPNITVDVVTTALLAEGTVPDPVFAADLPPSVTITRLPARVSTRATTAVAARHLGFVYYRGLRLLGAPDPAILDVPELVRGVLAPETERAHRVVPAVLERDRRHDRRRAHAHPLDRRHAGSVLAQPDVPPLDPASPP